MVLQKPRLCLEHVWNTATGQSCVKDSEVFYLTYLFLLCWQCDDGPVPASYLVVQTCPVRWLPLMEQGEGAKQKT